MTANLINPCKGDLSREAGGGLGSRPSPNSQGRTNSALMSCSLRISESILLNNVKRGEIGCYGTVDKYISPPASASDSMTSKPRWVFEECKLLDSRSELSSLSMATFVTEYPSALIFRKFPSGQSAREIWVCPVSKEHSQYTVAFLKYGFDKRLHDVGSGPLMNRGKECKMRDEKDEVFDAMFCCGGGVVVGMG